MLRGVKGAQRPNRCKGQLHRKVIFRGLFATKVFVKDGDLSLSITLKEEEFDIDTGKNVLSSISSFHGGLPLSQNTFVVFSTKINYHWKMIPCYS